jgi:hypothetical protein
MSTKLQEKLRCQKRGEEFIDETLSSIGRTPESQHYVKNAVLREEILRCKRENNGQASDELAKMFIQIATKLSNKLKYTNEEDRIDCIYTAVGDCIRYFSDFDETVTQNAFAYITSICRNGFAKGWRNLGYMKLPQSLQVSLSDNVYSI